MEKHYTLTISGKVQGVFYRGSSEIKALQLGLRGFVSNEQDGSVYMEIEGPEDKLKEMVAWCRQGPPHAQVSKVVVEEGTWCGFEGFEVRRG